MKSSKYIYGLDVETDWLPDKSKSWLVQWALVHSSGTYQTGSCLESLEQALISIYQSKTDVYVYSHNMTFDAHTFKYILPSLANSLHCDIQIIKPMSKIITIKLKSKTGRGCLHFRDSMAKIPSTLQELGDYINLPKLEGFEFYPLWSEKIDFSNSENWKYVIRDAEICAKAMLSLHNQGFTSATSSGDAWRYYKNKFGHPLKWEKHFPKFSYNFDLLLRQAYTGGLNFSFHKGYNKATNNRIIRHRDAVSMYPWTMINFPLPYGKPTKTNDIPHDKSLYVVEFYGKMTLKEGKPPIFMFKQKVDYILEDIKYGTPLEKCNAEHKFIITSVDFDTYSDYYDIEISDYKEPTFYVFKTKKGMFDEFIQEQADIKNKAKKGSLEREKAKLNMNGLYGRFALNPETTETALEFNDDELKFKQSKTLNDDNDAYLPISIFVTSYARQHLIRSAEKIGWDNLIHADTDSLIYYEYVTEDYTDPLEDTGELGSWKNECYPYAIYEGGVKRYIEILTPTITNLDSFSVACAGVPQKLNHEKQPIGMWIELLDNPEKICSEDTLGSYNYQIKSEWLRDLYINNGLNPDNVNTLKLIPIQVTGGLVLDERQHKLNDTVALRYRHRLKK